MLLQQSRLLTARVTRRTFATTTAKQYLYDPCGDKSTYHRDPKTGRGYNQHGSWTCLTQEDIAKFLPEQHAKMTLHHKQNMDHVLVQDQGSFMGGNSASYFRVIVGLIAFGSIANQWTNALNDVYN